MKSDQATDAESWVDLHGDCLYRYALLRLRAPDLAADVVQETFVEALEARDSFAGRASERTWLVGILRHKILDHFRKSGRERVVARSIPLEDAVNAAFDRRGHWKDRPAAWTGDPSRDLETREFWDVFGRCLSRLPSGIADAFLLREVDGLDADEVQQVLGITSANLWTRLHRARSVLRQCLESGWFGSRRSPPSRP
jgi:RNA polymerase sigma-70 factor (ECF subfamily)